MIKWLYSLESGRVENASQLLGEKGANLCEMTQIGLNVPPGFVVNTEGCLSYLGTEDRNLPKGLMAQVQEQMQMLEKSTGKGFGNAENPLLVSVRPSSAMSIPGMMGAILNLGLNQQTLGGLINQTDNERFGYDAYRRFIQLFAKVALGMPDEPFDDQLELVKEQVSAKMDVALKAEDLKNISGRFLEVVQDQTGQPFPEDPYEQLEIAIKVVFNSWMGKWAVDYRREFNITPDMANGTAVTVMSMVFGNLDNECACGEAFTRNPSTGKNQMHGEYLVNAQGEDVATGILIPKSISEIAEEKPDIFRQLLEVGDKLEHHYKQVQNFQFTIERNKLWVLGSRTELIFQPEVALNIACNMVDEGLITRDEAVRRISQEQLNDLQPLPVLKDGMFAKIAQGQGVSRGLTSGRLLFTLDTAEEIDDDLSVILVTGRDIYLGDEEKFNLVTTSIPGLENIKGFIVVNAGVTSHSCLIAREYRIPCVNFKDCSADKILKTLNLGSKVLAQGEIVTIDGESGDIYYGDIVGSAPVPTGNLAKFLRWRNQVAISLRKTVKKHTAFFILPTGQVERVADYETHEEVVQDLLGINVAQAIEDHGWIRIRKMGTSFSVEIPEKLSKEACSRLVEMVASLEEDIEYEYSIQIGDSLKVFESGPDYIGFIKKHCA